MKKDIKVFDYVRVKQGFLGKVENVNEFREPSMKYAVDFQINNSLNFVGDDDIIDSSDKIENLITVGDIIEVYEKLALEEHYFIFINKDYIIKRLKADVNDGDIKIISILTKEQIEKRKYLLGD